MTGTLTAAEVGQHLDIIAAARSNQSFRRVVDTGEHQQVVVMAIEVGGEIGAEVHPDTDQAFIFVEGNGEAHLDGAVRSVAPNDLVLVRAGTSHNFVNTGTQPLRLITIYAPPQHAPGTVHETKADADRAEAHEH
jgi:mannose-6-phosphate isomerase-like protein (cupin superfamily)